MAAESMSEKTYRNETYGAARLRRWRGLPSFAYLSKCDDVAISLISELKSITSKSNLNFNSGELGKLTLSRTSISSIHLL